MTFQELKDKLSKCTAKQLTTEVCGFDGFRFVYWVSHLRVDDTDHLYLDGTDDLGGHKCQTKT